MNTTNTQTPAATVGRTPGPWQAENGYIRDSKGRFLCVASDADGAATAEQNCAFIVTACNAYDGLVAENKRLREALEAVEARVNGEWDHPALVAHGQLQTDGAIDCLAIARAVLAASKEGQP